MNNLEKYLDQVIVEKPLPAEPPLPQEPSGPSTSEIMAGILRRWYIVLGVVVLLCGPGITAIWRLIQPLYSVAGAIQVAPIMFDPFGNAEPSGGSNVYESFMNTQAQMIVSPQVTQRVADDLKDRNLAFFKDETSPLIARIRQTLGNPKTKPEPAAILKQAILDGIITAGRNRKTELVTVGMQSKDAGEAKQIVDSFIRNYMVVEGSNASRGKDLELQTVEEQRNLVARKMEDQRAQINSLAQQFGDDNLVMRRDMKLQGVGKLMATLTETKARRIYLEAQLKFVEKKEQEGIAPDELLKMREDYISKDPALGILTTSILQLEQELIAAKQTLAPGNPELKQKEDLVAALQGRLEEKKKEAGEAFDKLISNELAKAGNRELKNLKNELEQTRVIETELSAAQAKEDKETIGLGRTQLLIQDLQDQMLLNKELKETLDRRIQELEMERKRPGRISKAMDADIAQVNDKRIKYTAGLVFGAFALGALLAFLRQKSDRSVRTPDDVVRQIGIRIIGTTTSTQTVKPARLPEQMAGDYQTIRANLGLLDGNGMPRKLVVTSPSMREGKTTFAINLALSMSRSGKKVLLIDGDLRKPDIAPLLGLPRGHKCLQDLILGAAAEQVVFTASEGLDVLAADHRHATAAFEMLASPRTAQCVDAISRNYDHVIIDTPPMLAFPDALIWAKIGDAVILTCFAGQTKAPDLKEAKRRLTQIKVKVLGTVLSNVEAGNSYYRYGYDYYSRYAHSGKGNRRARRKMLLPVQDSESSKKDS